MKKKTKIVVLVIATIGILSVLFVFVYQKPVKVNKTITICTLEGDTKEIRAEGTWRRYLLAPTRFDGTITVDGKAYTDFYNSQSFFEELKRKIENRFPVHRFLGRTDDFMKGLKDCYYIEFDQKSNLNNAFCSFHAWKMTDEDQGVEYYSAKNAEEAEKLRDRMFGVSQ